MLDESFSDLHSKTIDLDCVIWSRLYIWTFLINLFYLFIPVEIHIGQWLKGFSLYLLQFMLVLLIEYLFWGLLFFSYIFIELQVRMHLWKIILSLLLLLLLILLGLWLWRLLHLLHNSQLLIIAHFGLTRWPVIFEWYLCSIFIIKIISSVRLLWSSICTLLSLAGCLAQWKIIFRYLILIMLSLLYMVGCISFKHDISIGLEQELPKQLFQSLSFDHQLPLRFIYVKFRALIKRGDV